MNPRLIILALAILVTVLSVGGAFLWGVFAGVRAVLGALLRLGLILILVVIILALFLMSTKRR
ncbi:MAG: hypothetical protein RMJ28_05795 [Nitrososphaerota archaeon]|nr:hypothetical protein [Candidatus Calditenuaceae archaeon]MDW8073726.1 hypothetical protein [Nitrososphaerota archaeon]